MFLHSPQYSTARGMGQSLPAWTSVDGVIFTAGISVYNGQTAGWIVTVSEDQNGLAAIMEKCGPDGKYDCAHYQDDLKFKVFGTKGDQTFSIPGD